MRLGLIAALTAVLWGSACQGDVGTIQVTLVTAPGSTVLDQVTRARLTLDNPLTVVESERGADGSLTLDIDVVAEGTAGTLTLEGFDAGGTLVAYGTTAPLPVAAFEGVVKLYVAPPMSIAEAAVELGSARSDMAQALLTFGVVWAGGRDAAGSPTDDMVIYNVYDHDFQIGLELPESRAEMTAMPGSAGKIFLFGGVDSADNDTGTAWMFDTNVAPAGQYSTLVTDAGLNRSGASAAAIDIDTFMITGDPLVVLDGITNRVRTLSGPALEGTATTVTVNGIPNTLIAGLGSGASGATLFVGNQFIELVAPSEASRTGHAAVTLADGDILIIGGGTLSGLQASAVRYDPEERELTVIPDVLETPRSDAAVAATTDYIIVAGGSDASGVPVANAEILDATTLSRVATLPLLVARTGARAAPLANGQVIIAGGRDVNDAPTATIELFTPRP
jgi:hypothetical protein